MGDDADQYEELIDGVRRRVDRVRQISANLEDDQIQLTREERASLASELQQHRLANERDSVALQGHQDRMENALIEAEADDHRTRPENDNIVQAAMELLRHQNMPADIDMTDILR